MSISVFGYGVIYRFGVFGDIAVAVGATDRTGEL